MNWQDSSGSNPDDELVAWTNLTTKCDAEVLAVALNIAKDPGKDLCLRNHALKILHKNKSIYRDFFRNHRVVEDIEKIARELNENQEEGYLSFNLNRLAFQCLKQEANNLSNNFYEFFAERIFLSLDRENNNTSDKNLAFEKLSQYLATCGNNAKFRLLEALSVAISESRCDIDFAIFQKFKENFWSRELLTFALLGNNRSWDVEQVASLVEKIVALDLFIKESIHARNRHSIEEVLMILIDAQSSCNLDVGFINEILTVVNRDFDCLDAIAKDFVSLPAIIDELKLLKLKNRCDLYEIIHNGEEDLTKLNDFLVCYSDKANDWIFDNVEAKTRASDLISFLEILNECDLCSTRKEEFLFDLDPSERSVNEWIKKLCLEIVEAAIRREFPKYDKTYPNDSNNEVEKEIDRKYLSPVTCNDAKLFLDCCESSKSHLNNCLDNASESKKSINKLLQYLERSVAKNLLRCGWSKKFHKLLKCFIKCLDSEEKIVQLTNTLKILEEYEIDLTEKEVGEIFSRSTLNDLERNIHGFVIEKTFPGTREKTFDDLIEELVLFNKKEDIGSRNLKEMLMTNYADIMESYSNESSLLPGRGPINSWQKKDIMDWVKKLKGHPQNSRTSKNDDPLSVLMDCVLFPGRVKRPRTENDDDPLSELLKGGIFGDLGKNVGISLQQIGSEVSKAERIAVIKKTAELISNFPLREIQLLSVILLLNCQEKKGRLAQVNTGEGKTMIIAMIAAYHAINGNKVDVITSSPLLAKPQSKEQRPFYSALGLTVSHNVDNHSEGYKCDIVYGTCSAFQGDILRDEFRKRETKGDRKCEIAIVDEVDNMLIDGNNYIVMLSSEMPAMDHLEGIIATIFIQIKNAANSIVYENGEAFYLDTVNMYDEKGEIRKNVVDNAYPINMPVEDFLMNCTEPHIRKLIRDVKLGKEEEDSLPELKIPKHLREFICKVQLKKWIKKAIAAKFSYHKDEDYILRDGEIKIVDAANTGCVKNNSEWSNALHQMLQIKHGAKITPESLTTNFISNVGFFKRYPPNLYGLTGTLGTNGTKELLRKTYDVDSIIVPPFKLKQHKELTGIVVNNVDDWYKEIARSCFRKLKNGRAALIIMEFIRETDELAKIFIDYFGYEADKVKLYKTEKDEKVIEEKMKPGDLLITTNIAGRGTDIKLVDEIDPNGGLHVCLTFLPINSRVEVQNTGRTSRTGNRGTSQFVLCNSDNFDIKKLKAIRAKGEKIGMENASKEIVRVTTKDMIFRKFCHLMDEIEDENDFTKRIKKKAVEERFAIWLEKNEDLIDEETREKSLEAFDKFVEDVKNDNKHGNLIKNPYMHVTIGNYYLDRKEYKEAIGEYTLAIKLDPNYGENARFNRGYALIAQYGSNVDKNLSQIEKAVKDFKEARKLIADRQTDLNLVQSASDGQVLSEQVRNKLNLYTLQTNAIDLAIGPDRKALKKQLKHLKSQISGENRKLSSTEKEQIKESIENLKERKKLIGIVNKVLSNKEDRGDLEIELKPLKESLAEDDLKSHRSEIVEFERNGFIGEFTISEIPPIDWNAVIGLLLLGFAQIVGGAALMIFTLGGGASFGLSLITEGISDIITAIKDGIINRNFNWTDWAIEKAISLTVAVICAGYKAIKDCAKTTLAGAKNIAQSCTKKIFTETVKEGWKIAAKRAGMELAKGVGKQLAITLAEHGIDKTLIPHIEAKIVETIHGPIEQALLNNPTVEKMLKLDEKVNKNRYYENRIIEIGEKILNPKTNRDLLKIALEISSRVANNKVKYLAVTRQVAEAAKALWDLYNVVPKLIEQLNNEIEIEARKMKIHDKSVEEIIREKEDKGRSKNSPNEEEQVKIQDRPPRTPKEISKKLTKAAANNMIGIIKDKIITPVVQHGVDYAADKIVKSVEDSLQHETKIFRAHKRIIHHQDKGYKRDETERDRDIVRRDENSQSTLSLVDDLIRETREGGPSGIYHLGAASDATGSPIEILNAEGKIMDIIGKDKKGITLKVEFHQPINGQRNGHYTLPGGENPTNNNNMSENERNMCLYNALAAQTHLDPNTLKDMTLTIMQNNRSTLAKQINDIAYLEIYSRMRLAMGGTSFNNISRFEQEAAFYIKNKHDTPMGPSKLLSKPRNIVHQPGDHHISYRDKTLDNKHGYGQSGKQSEMNSKLDESIKKMDSTKNISPATKTMSLMETDLGAARKTEYVSKSEAVYVKNYLMRHPDVENAIAKFDKYENGARNTDEYIYTQIIVDSGDLNMPRTAYRTDFVGEKIQHVRPINGLIQVRLRKKFPSGEDDQELQLDTSFL